MNIIALRSLPSWLVAGGLGLLLSLGAPCTNAQTPAMAIQQMDYPLGAGDSIRIQVYQNPDLTMETRVSENGVITYPLIGAVQVGGQSIAVAEATIAQALQSGGFLQKPQVNITLLLVRGNQVSVLGLVARPGRFALDTVNTRLSDMIATAGGSLAAGDDVAIITGTREGKPFRRQVDVPSIFIDANQGSDIVLQGGDSIYVHRAPVYYIYGEAQRSGSYRIERDMTIMQALAQAGGVTGRGSEKRLRLHRRFADGRVLLMEPGLTDLVLPNDVLFVKESLF
jgi:polysaccharide export outer membrane protein